MDEHQKNIFCFLLLLPLLFSWKINDDAWQSKKHKSFTFYYTEPDKADADEYANFVYEGKNLVENFSVSPIKTDLMFTSTLTVKCSTVHGAKTGICMALNLNAGW